MKKTLIWIIGFILFVNIATALLTDIRFNPASPTVADDLTVLATYNGTNPELDRVVYWSKNNVFQDYLNPPLVSYFALNPHVTDLSTNVTNDGSAINNNHGAMTGFSRNDGTVSGGVTISDGAYIINNGVVDTGYNLDTGSDFSFSIWLKNLTVTTTNNNALILKTNSLIVAVRSDNILRIMWSTTGSGVNAGVNTVFSQMYSGFPVLLTITYNGSNVKVYYNGTLKNSFDANIVTNANSITNQQTDEYIASIYNYMIYTKELSLTEITEIYNAGKDSYTPVSSGLVAQYSGRDYAGTEASPTTIYDTNMFVAGHNNNIAMVFGAGFVNLGNPVETRFGMADDFTYSIWMNTNDFTQSNQIILADKNSGSAVGTFLRLTSNKFGYNIGNGTTEQPFNYPISETENNIWVNYVVVKDGNNVVLYRNGVASSTLPITLGGDFQRTTANLYIGARLTGNLNFNGSISNVQIYNRALTSTEISYLYNNTYLDYLDFNLTEDNYNINDVVTFNVLSSDGVTKTNETISLNYTVDVQTDYDTPIWSGSYTDYILTLISNPSLKSASASLFFSGHNYSTELSINDHNMTLLEQIGHTFNSAELNNSLYFTYTLTGQDEVSITYNTTTEYQIIKNAYVDDCSNYTVNTLLFQIHQEDTLEGINDTINLKGFIDYWNNYDLGTQRYYIDMNVLPSSTVTGWTIDEFIHTIDVNRGYSQEVRTPLTWNFQVKQKSYLSYYFNRCYANPSYKCENRTIEIWKTACNTGTLLASMNTTDLDAGKYYETSFNYTDYSEYLEPDIIYCIKDYHVNNPTYNSYVYKDVTTDSYDGEILTITNQQMFYATTNPLNNGKMYLSSVTESTAYLCLSDDASLYYDATLEQEKAYLMKWYIKNDTISNSAKIKTLYNYNTTDTTEAVIINLYEDQFSRLPNVRAELQRYYLSSDTWRTVQMDITDELGKAIFYVREEDTDYRILFYDGTEQIGQTSKLKFKCPLFTDCEVQISILGFQSEYVDMLEDVTFKIYPNILSLRGTDTQDLYINVSSSKGAVSSVKIYATYNGTLYENTLYTLTGGQAKITIPLLNVTEPEKLTVYYEIKHVNGQTFSLYRDYWIYAPHSTPMFFDIMIFLTSELNSFWLAFFTAIMTIGIIGLVASLGVGNMPVLAILTMAILGVFTYFGWFPFGYFIVMLFPVIAISFLMGGRA